MKAIDTCPKLFVVHDNRHWRLTRWTSRPLKKCPRRSAGLNSSPLRKPEEVLSSNCKQRIILWHDAYYSRRTPLCSGELPASKFRALLGTCAGSNHDIIQRQGSALHGSSQSLRCSFFRALSMSNVQNSRNVWSHHFKADFLSVFFVLFVMKISTKRS